MAMTIPVLDLFSAAAGGWSLGMHRAGYTTMAACEAVDWRRALYSQNNPGVRIYDDVCTLTAERLLADFGYLPTVVVGSPPCQDISSANTKGKGVDGERSGLFFEAVRIIGECRPRWFALENSANLRTRGADRVVTALAGIGYTCWPFVVRAGDGKGNQAGIGANHERARSWLIGCDIEQVANSDGIGRDEGRSWGRGGFNVSVSGDLGDASEDGCGSGLSRGCPGATRRAEQPPCGDATHSDEDGEHAPRVDGEMAELRRLGGDRAGHSSDSGSLRKPELSRGSEQEAPVAGNSGEGQDAHAPEIGSEGLAGNPWRGRQGEDTERADISARPEMGLRPDDRGSPDGSGPLWSLADLAGRVRLDDGLPARLAGTRVAVGGPKGTAAASLIVEAYGDAVVPQIPEAIGRAILRVERAMQAVRGIDA